MSVKIPKNISPDSIKHAIVEIRYTTTIQFEMFLGMIYKPLKDSYSYSTRQITEPQTGKQITEGFCFNDYINISIKKNGVVFQFAEKYISWQKFQPEIERLLDILNSTELIEQFTRVGVRFINEYQQISLEDCINFQVKNLFENSSVSSYSYNSVHSYGNNIIASINLRNNIPKIPDNIRFPIKEGTNKIEIKVHPISIIDIDVLVQPLNTKSVTEVLNATDGAHNITKNIFYSMLKNEFLEKLNPKY